MLQKLMPNFSDKKNMSFIMETSNFTINSKKQNLKKYIAQQNSISHNG